jgi:glutamate-1-semialdehyde 2,1-aminomutase
MSGVFGMDAHVGKVVAVVGAATVLSHLDRMQCVLYTAGAYFLTSTVAETYLGMQQSDSIIIFATLLSLKVFPMLAKRLVTIAATYPLALVFKYVSHLIPKYVIKEENFYDCDGCLPEVAQRREKALKGLSEKWSTKYKKCIDFSAELKKMMSDVRFISGRCFPAFNEVIGSYLDPSMALDKTDRMNVTDIDGNSAMDISGSYGVNVCGYEKYKEFIEEGWSMAKSKGLFLGSLDSIVLDNIARLRKVSGHDEVSWHMSGTEAVMAAVRCARWNTKKRMVVTFGGAYHGWWDGMQPVVGNDRLPDDVLCLKDMAPLSLTVLTLRASEIAAVLINPLQCFHINQSPPSDLVLSGTTTPKVGVTPGYKEWLHKLRKVCSESGIVLIFDEVYTGFRLHPRGAQGIYEVNADIVTYGKTLGGGLPIGVVCGPKRLLMRGEAKKAARVNYVIGTFAGHPFVMSTMNAFLRWLEKPETLKSYDTMHENIEAFVTGTNAALKKAAFPVELVNWYSVWSMKYTKPSRFHWMFQYYLRDAGVNLSWVGTGRLLFSLDWQKADYDLLQQRILAAAEEMQKGGWWEDPQASIKKKLGGEMLSAFVRNLIA